MKFGNEEGGSLVEFAIASLLLIMMLFGIIEFSFAFYGYHFTAEAAKEAARYASVRGSNACTTANPNLADYCLTGAGDNTRITALVAGLGYPGINSANTTAQLSLPDGDNAVGHNVKVDVYYTFPIAVPYWKATRLQMHSTAQMVISN
ncbi:TadE/TadG family type IV pilus assembly protein [Occallatibacter savannae]|uniref:TadE/TadG family type IV pilus assembly protein n=1 Tax=Occallatibacter savannae TaxID=1002691 RepID=UPI0013A54128|nr:TadE/TadG family type IV pilus assembly protein [Occallatibacter savannae]